MVIFPGLNEDCAFLILDSLDTPSLVSVALTSRSALVPARERIAREARFTHSERAAAFLSFLVAHSLEPALRTLSLSFGTTHQTTWLAILADVLPRAKRLNQLEIHLGTIACEPPVFKSLGSFVPALTHLRIDALDSRTTNFEGVRGLKVLACAITLEGQEAMASKMRAVRTLIANNAGTLEDVSLAGPHMGVADAQFSADEPVCPHVTRLALHKLSFDLKNAARMFTNVEWLSGQGCDPVPTANPNTCDAFPGLTTLIGPENLLLTLLAHNDYPHLRRIVVQPHFMGMDPGIQPILDIIRVRRIHELSVTVPSTNFTPVSRPHGAMPFLSQIARSAPCVRTLDVNIFQSDPMQQVAVTRLTPDSAHPLEHLTNLSLSLPSVLTTVTEETLQTFARPWFTNCPNLVCMWLHLCNHEFRWTRRWMTTETGQTRSLVTPHYRHNTTFKGANRDDEAYVFAPNDHDQESTAWSTHVRPPSQNLWVLLRENMVLTDFWL